MDATTGIALQDATLDALPDGVLRPEYDRAALSPGIVHIGLGNFHRAHQAWYLHRLMQAGKAPDWAIIGAGMRAYDAAMRERLLAQDCLTTLVELDPAGTQFEVTGAMIDYLPIEDGNPTLIRQMADSAIRIVALTITEGGYYRDPATGAFDPDHPDMLHDAANPETPRTAFGAMVAALSARRAAGVPPFTVLSCDNLQGNGLITGAAVVGLAQMSDPVLAAWIKAEGAFPNSMVDCIVPATSPALIARVHAAGIEDAAPVSHERFRQWVIEDDFCNGRPPWEEVGATLTDDVHAYEAMKIRILNGGHQVLANAGEILALETIADCMADPQVAAYFNEVQTTGILPQVTPVPGMTPAAYLTVIERRFANPEIRDSTRRVAFDGSSRHTGFMLPTLREALAAGRDVSGLALAEALWARMCQGTREDGSEIAPNDPFWDARQAAALTARETPQTWLAQEDVYGDLAEDAVFAEAFCGWLDMLWQKGTRATLTHFLES